MSKYDDLRDYKKMLDENLIDESDYQKKKEELLFSGPSESELPKIEPPKSIKQDPPKFIKNEKTGQNKLKEILNTRNGKIGAVVIAIFLVLVSVLVIANTSEHKMKGKYQLDYLLFGTEKIGHHNGSYISIAGIDDYSTSLIYTVFGDSVDSTYGYVTKVEEYDNYIQYKLWITEHVGTFFTDDNSYVYLKYYPDEDRVVFEGKYDNSHYVFSYNK